jgi:glutamate-5-semialdehyde dehydrogenase
MNTARPKTAGTSLQQDLLATREASRGLPACTESSIEGVLNDLAGRVLASTKEILAANARDLARMDRSDPKYDRLLLNPERLQAVAADLRSVAKLPNPVGEVLQQKTLENGLALSKVRVPMGVIAVIFESRPNVAFDVFALCLKTRNACVLKGSSDAHDTNLVAVSLMQQALSAHAIDPRVVLLAPPQRECITEILQAVGLVDLAIPRGSRGLIDFVREQARIPVIETGAGVVHTYVDKSARLDAAAAIITNAKARRVSVCNALDTLLVHRDALPSLPVLLQELGQRYDVEVFADEEAHKALDGRYPAPLQRARDEHFGQEFLAYRMSVKTVAGLDEALDHIHRYGSRHSEAVLAEDPAVIERFLSEVDAAVVLANTSTAFTDGGQFGMGAEIGISTQKLHARGPMALPELTSYKWVVRGAGQVRPAD